MNVTAIDPDLRKSGICTLNENGEIMLLKSMDIIELIDYAKANPEHMYAIEDVNKISAMYRRGYTNAAVKTTIAQRVGMVKGVATLINQIVESCTGREPMQAPVGLGKQVKNDAKLFNQLSGWTGKSNEDMRDAWAIARWVWVISEATKL